MKKYLILLLVSLSVFSCSDEFLERPPLGNLTAGTFPETEGDALLATNAIYNSLREWHINTGGFPLLDIMSDQATKGSNPGDGAATAPFEDFSFDANDAAIERWYKTVYQAIRRANLVITELPSITMDATLQTRLLAEARFLRGYFYSILIRGFEEVPLVTVVDPPLDLGKTPQMTIFQDLIVPDLEFAIGNLPEKSDYSDEDMGRASRGAAKALLARLYLYFGDFNEVENLTMEIISSGQYDLEADFAEVFLPSTEHGIESIFEVGALPLGTGDGGNQYGNTQGIRGTPNRGWGFGRPAYPWIIAMQANDDPRMEHSVIFLGEVMPDGAVTSGDGSTPDTTYDNSNNIIEIEVYNQKAWHPGTSTQESFGHNRRIIRYSDILLMAAEALNENGKPNDALPLLNEVRERARGGDNGILPDVVTTDQALLRQAIADERNFELAFEGRRYWDLVRTDKASSVLGPLGYLEKHKYFPLPQSEVDISEGRIPQNPAWN